MVALLMYNDNNRVLYSIPLEVLTITNNNLIVPVTGIKIKYHPVPETGIKIKYHSALVIEIKEKFRPGR